MIHTVFDETGAGRPFCVRLLRDRDAARAFAGIVAASGAMQEVLRWVERVAHSAASTVLVLGESGVGKGVIARGLHEVGADDEAPFVHVTCSTLTDSLLESELFGHEKGAFTDARREKQGLIELAHGGTLFLDEIGDLSPRLQGNLLRFLDDRVFRRVGGTRDRRVDVRVVAATNKDLDEEVRKGRFRSDLYFRLKVVPIVVPPLRARPTDIGPLTDLFVQSLRSELRSPVTGATPAARGLLERYPFPGNVRELRNAIERAMLLCEHELLDVDDLPLEVRQGSTRLGPHLAEPGTQVRFELPPQGVVLADVERDLVSQALRRAQGNRTRAARLLGMNRDQVRYRITKYGLDEEAAAATGTPDGDIAP